MNMLKVATVTFLISSGAFAAEPASEPAPRSESASAGPAVSTDPAPAASQSSGQKAPAATGRRTNDRLELNTTIVTGNRELPKVMYIVPWKKADIGELPAQPFNTLLDEALTPVDRDVFRREVTYYGAVSAGGDRASPASAAPAAGPEK